MRPPVRSLRRRATSDNYDRKLKPTPRKQEKYDKKRRKHLKTHEKKRHAKTPNKGGNNGGGGVAGAGHVIDTCSSNYCAKTERL
jgi:hypothetical protein